MMKHLNTQGNPKIKGASGLCVRIALYQRLVREHAFVIINFLYLLQNNLLRIPVLYLSRYIIQHRTDYYRLLQAVRDNGVWQEWVLFMLEAVACTSRQTLILIVGIKELMVETKHRLRAEFPQLTATRYLDKLAAAGYLDKRRIGHSNYYVNKPLVELLSNLPELS